MSLIGNSQNVQFATEFSIDKIVGIYVDSFDASHTTVLGGYLYQYAIPHKFTRPVFCELLWSLDGITYATGGTGVLSGNFAISYSDSNNIYVTTSLGSGTIYYKVIASWIDNYDTTNPAITPVLNTTQNFYFDSRNNYQKIYKQNVVTINTGQTVSILHPDLDFAPNAKVFFESFPGQVWPTISGGVSDFFFYDPGNQYECHATMNLSTLDITMDTGPSSARAWYRIYAND